MEYHLEFPATSISGVELVHWVEDQKLPSFSGCHLWMVPPLFFPLRASHVGDSGMTTAISSRVRRDTPAMAIMFHRQRGCSAPEGGHVHMTSALPGEGVSQYLTQGREVVWIW